MVSTSSRLKEFFIFLTKFILLFLICYYGTEIIIGLSSPGGHYSAFVANHLDYVSWIKKSLISTTQWLLSFYNIETYQAGNDVVRIKYGMGVKIAYGCVGYGVFSFWIAYVISNRGLFGRKLFLIVFGLLILWIINVIRISLFLVAINKQWPMPLGLDHHTWFTIVSYIAIFVMIYFFEKKSIQKSEY
ncbi:MAG: exosortase/archaeosortase family protein [Bacteroidota bacterium]